MALTQATSEKQGEQEEAYQDSDSCPSATQMASKLMAHSNSDPVAQEPDVPAVELRDLSERGGSRYSIRKWPVRLLASAQSNETDERPPTLEQLSHLKIVLLFFPLPALELTLMPAPLISALGCCPAGGAVGNTSARSSSSSRASTFGAAPAAAMGMGLADGEPLCITPEADVNETDVSEGAGPWGGGEPDRESCASELRAAAAV